MGLVSKDDGWRIPDKVWAQMEPLLPARPVHPLGCHRPRVPDRDAMNAILLVLRTGMQWNALRATGICSCSSAYRRFREWAEAGVSSSSGGVVCSPTTSGSGSTGSGWRWTARSARRL
jgi:transposase